jgi:hypothetical protein
MSIPLDQLYNFLESCVDHDLIIYRWNPYGSRNLDDLTPLKDYRKINGMYHTMITPSMICHDQEPLNYQQYDREYLIETFSKKNYSPNLTADAYLWIDQVFNWINFKMGAKVYHFSAQDYTLLLHSEKNSIELSKYQTHKFVPVYYWSHAVIARDWFRYAQLDPKLNQNCQSKFDFLIYNRAWAGTREYRLKFTESIVTNNLIDQCCMGFSAVDNQTHYRDHQFVNANFCVDSPDLEQHFFNNSTPGWASGDYNSFDYNQTRIEVVLETLFDDSRLHLTEKTLRPIACGQPFLLMATAGSLKYLHSYGFKTFGEFIDESYDDIQDPLERLNAVIELMKNFSRMSTEKKDQLVKQMLPICEYNRNRFFSNEFLNLIINEYQQNLTSGLVQVNQLNQGALFYASVELYQQQHQLDQLINSSDLAAVTKWLRR